MMMVDGWVTEAGDTAAASKRRRRIMHRGGRLNSVYKIRRRKNLRKISPFPPANHPKENLVGSRKQPRCSQIAARTGEGGRLCDDDGSEAGRARNIWRACGYSWGIRDQTWESETGSRRSQGRREEGGGRGRKGFSSCEVYKGEGGGWEGRREVGAVWLFVRFDKREGASCKCLYASPRRHILLLLVGNRRCTWFWSLMD
jgi:hypothetical protein